MNHCRKDFADVEALLKSYCAKNGWTYEPKEINRPVYQLAQIKGKDFCIVAYPHQTTSTRNFHIRLRDQGSKDKEAYHNAVYGFYNSKTFINCTFQTKNFDSNEARKLEKGESN